MQKTDGAFALSALPANGKLHFADLACSLIAGPRQGLIHIAARLIDGTFIVIGLLAGINNAGGAVERPFLTRVDSVITLADCHATSPRMLRLYNGQALFELH
jgi:hypothetical protein